MLDYHNEPHGVYLMIDNKSFFASIESVQRGIDPLDSVLLVMAEHENNGSGLVVATSPLAKKHFGIRNVDRGYKVPSDARLLTVPPRLALYRQKTDRSIRFSVAMLMLITGGHTQSMKASLI